jgi:CheY-like chemotaxis protein
MKEEATILLVEDNELDIELTLDAFREVHFENKMQIVRNGEEAIWYLKGEDKYSDRSVYPLPDLILLDLNLPRVNGIDVLRTIKQVDKIKRIPVIILTSSKEEGDRALSYDGGANSYLVKPISFEGFCEVVAKISDYWLALNVPPPEERK